MIPFMFWDKKAQGKNQNCPAVTALVRSAVSSSLFSNNADNVKQITSLIFKYLYTYYFPMWVKRKHKVCSKEMIPLAEGTKYVSRLGLSFLLLQA